MSHSIIVLNIHSPVWIIEIVNLLCMHDQTFHIFFRNTIFNEIQRFVFPLLLHGRRDVNSCRFNRYAILFHSLYFNRGKWRKKTLIRFLILFEHFPNQLSIWFEPNYSGCHWCTHKNRSTITWTQSNFVGFHYFIFFNCRPTVSNCISLTNRHLTSNEFMQSVGVCWYSFKIWIFYSNFLLIEERINNSQ